MTGSLDLPVVMILSQVNSSDSLFIVDNSRQAMILGFTEKLSPGVTVLQVV